MATLVLSTVGTVIGGPVGGAIGSMLGQAIDARIFAPKGRKGPRLSDLRVQTSSYGTAIPRVMGRMRVSGTVIWASDLIEHRKKSSTGKGRPSVINYTYSASFAVALSSRAIADVGRIWAEGNLLRGKDGTFKSQLGFRLYRGTEDQMVDALIASAEGVAASPAYRGIAYAVFEDMDLAPFGNRIPSLSFEVIGDLDELSIGEVIADALGGANVASVTPAIHGAVQLGETRRETVATLLRLVPTQRDTALDRWQVGEGPAAAHSIGEPASGERRARQRIHYAGSHTRPAHIALSCYDPDRDFQSTVQTARVAGGDGAAERIDLPVAASAAVVKAMAETLSTHSARGGVIRERPCGFAALAVPPGARVLLNDGQAARVVERKIEGVQLLLQLDDAPPLVWHQPGAADGGRANSTPDQPIGASLGHVLDLPLGSEGGLASRGGLMLAATGTGVGWRSAVVEVSAGAGAPSTPIGSIGATPAMGTVVAVSGMAQAVLLDIAGSFDVDLLRADMILGNLSDEDLLAGGNLATVGRELIQFGKAVPLGDRRWRLSRLLRGRMGTEEAMARSVVGEQFTLIDPESLLPIPATIGLNGVGIGGEIRVTGIGDSAPVTLPIVNVAQSRLPLSSVHLGYAWGEDGALTLWWIRRSRNGFIWRDGVDAPLDERVEHYRVSVVTGASSLERECVVPSLHFASGQVATWRGESATLAISVRQIGEFGESSPLTGSILL